MAHVSGNPTWVDYPAEDTLITAAALEGIEGQLDRNPDDLGICRVEQTTVQTVPATANVALEFQLTRTSTTHVTVTSETTLTINTEGLYLLSASIGYNTASNTSVSLWIGSPDFTTARYASTSAGFTTATFPSLTMAIPVYLSAGTDIVAAVYNFAQLDTSGATYGAQYLSATLLRRS